MNGSYYYCTCELKQNLVTLWHYDFVVFFMQTHFELVALCNCPLWWILFDP